MVLANTKKEIHAFCIEKSFVYGKAYIEALATQFPFLTDIDAHLTPHIKRLYISGQLPTPLFIVNDTIIFNNTSSAPTHLFAKEFYTDLPVITVPRLLSDPKQVLTSQEITLFKQLPFELFKPYTIVWHDMTDAYLYPKDSSFVSLRFHAQSIPTIETMKKYKRLCDEYEQPSSPKKKAVHWVADVRFEKQIIVSIDRQKGGNYGTRT